MIRLPLPDAVLLGVIAGTLAAVDSRLAVGFGLCAVAILIVIEFGVERLTEVAWFAAALLAPMNGLRVTSFAALTDLALLVAVGATFVTAVVAHRPLTFRRPDRGLLAGLSLIALGGLIGTVFAGRPEQSLLVMAKFVVAAFGSIVALALWSASAKKLRRFCWAWLIGALLSVMWAATGSAKIGGRPEGLANHPNHLGLVCVLGFGLALGLSATAGGRERGAARVIMFVLVGGALLSGSRAAVLGLLAIVPVWSILSARWDLAIRCLAGGALLALVLASGVLHLPANSGAQRLLGGQSSVESNAARRLVFKDSVDRFARHPLTGEGFEFAQEAHNIYLQVLVAGGPLALMGLGLVVISVARPVVRVAAALRRGPLDRRLLLPVGMVAGYAGYLCAALFQNILWDRYLWLFVAAALGLIAAVVEEENTPVSRDNASLTRTV